MAEPQPLAEQDRPDVEDLSTAGDWLAKNAVTLLIFYDPTTDTVRIDRGATPRTVAAAILGKAWHEDGDDATWGEPEEEDWEDEEDV